MWLVIARLSRNSLSMTLPACDILTALASRLHDSRSEVFPSLVNAQRSGPLGIVLEWSESAGGLAGWVPRSRRHSSILLPWEVLRQPVTDWAAPALIYACGTAAPRSELTLMDEPFSSSHFTSAILTVCHMTVMLFRWSI